MSGLYAFLQTIEAETLAKMVGNTLVSELQVANAQYAFLPTVEAQTLAKMLGDTVMHELQVANAHQRGCSRIIARVFEASRSDALSR